MSAGAVDVYVYYRVDDAKSVEARACIASLFALIERDLGIIGRIYRRQDDARTWMEVYANVRDAARFERALEEGVDALGLRALLAAGSARHAERFVALGSV